MDGRRDSLVSDEEVDAVNVEVVAAQKIEMAQEAPAENAQQHVVDIVPATAVPIETPTPLTEDQEAPLRRRSILAPREGADLSWRSLSFTVGGKKILKENSGSVPRGKLCAIMGPSGAGKTSLLNLLAGRVSSSRKVHITGEIKLNDKVVKPHSISYRQKIAYVMQDDALPATDTPREALTFSATLRLPQATPRDKIKIRVNQMLEELGLTKCADVLIGNEMIKGISGGERKRTSVGVELITHPSIVFLDEPTSGLDSFAAYNCVETLRKVARAGSGVLCTVHQPSSEIFDLFDWVILLAAGKIVYSGPTQACGEYFAQKGFPSPNNYNLADHIMFTVQRLSEDELDVKKMFMNVDDPPAHERVRRESFLEEPKEMVVSKASWCTQLWLLSKREVRSITRNKIALVARFGITIFISLLFGVIFFEAGKQNDDIPENLQAHYGALTFAAISAMFGSAQPALLSFPFERPIFLREYSTGTYAVTPYFTSKTMSELPLTLATNIVQWLFVYFMVGFRGNFGLQVLAAWGLGSASASVAVMLGCVMNDVKQATEAAPLLFVPQLLFAGFFIRIDQIPVWLQWAQYTCSLKYALNLLVLTEFNDNDCGTTIIGYDGKTACQRLRAANDIKEDQKWYYIGALIALFAGFRLIGAFFLARRAKQFY